MAAHSNSFIRVRLLFDYPPPAVVGCRMCWLLVDLNTCRVVADLESVIREKFDFGRGSILSLFVEGCYLPHTESACVVRDNDSVRVKVDSLGPVNGHSGSLDASSEHVKKRQRDVEEDGPEENGVIKKKRKKRSVEKAVRDTVQASGDERNKEPIGLKIKKKKKKKKQKKAEEKAPLVVSKPAASPKKTPVKVPKTPPVGKSKPQKASSSDASSSSEEDEAPKKPAPQKAAPKAPPTTTPTATRAPPTTKLTQTKSRTPSTSSSETSSDESAVVKSTAKPPSTSPKEGANLKSQQATPGQQSAKSVAAPGDDSDSEEEIKLVIRQPAQQPVLGLGAHRSPWRGRGQGGRGQRGEGQSGRGGRGEGQRGRGGRGEERGRGSDRGAAKGRGASFGFRYEGAEEPSCRTDQLTNLSAVLQNGAESAPKKDYSCMPLLAAPPQVGQKIAFKLLELTENYTPEVSQYKEGKIVSFDLTTKQIELQLLNSFQAPVEPGKFDLVYQNVDGSESVEYAVVRGSRVNERWDSLLEPRLII
ncbi:coilin [Spinachia spinachia]